MPTHGARLLAATDHRDLIRANIGNDSISRGGIRLQVSLMPDVGTAAIGRTISSTSGAQVDEPISSLPVDGAAGVHGAVSTLIVSSGCRASGSSLAHVVTTR